MVFKSGMYFFLLLFSITSCAFQDSNIEVIEVEMPLERHLHTKSCAKYKDVNIDWVYGEREKKTPVVVYVHCSPHDSLKELPLRAVFKCVQKEDWMCDEIYSQVIMRFDNRLLAVTSDKIYLSDAIDIFRFLNVNGKFQDDGHFKKDRDIENECSVYKLKHSKWSVMCDKWGADLSQICEAKNCKYEFLSEGPVVH